MTEQNVEKRIFGRKWSVWMADSVIKKFPELRNRWAYDYGVLCKGLELVYGHTKKQEYYDYIKANMDYFVQSDGTIRFYDMDAFNLDFVNNGKTILYLYHTTGDKKYAKAAHLLREQLRKQPRTSEGGFWHKKRYPNQMWLDGLYMAEPFYAEYIRTFEPDASCEDILTQFRLTDTHLKDAKTHLLYHGWDESRTCFWADKETGRSLSFWGRSMGWYACALVDVLDYLNDGGAREELIRMVRDLAEAVTNVQSVKTSVWYQVCDKENQYGNYPEASCSCMFTYFLAKAVRKGYIGRKYFQNAKRAFYGLIREFIEVDEQAFLNLKGTVYVSGLGGDPFRDGSYEYYISEPKQLNNLLGIGAFLMACSELEYAAEDENIQF